VKRSIIMKPAPLPRCKCGKVCAYYGEIGGFSVQCVDCNAKHAAWQRKNRRKLKRQQSSAGVRTDEA